MLSYPLSSPMNCIQPDEENPAPRQQCVIVLGMHRSGTSALTGLLDKIGGELPKSLMPATDNSALGYFESQCLSDFNNKVLRTLGSGWDFWTPLPAGWAGSPAYRNLQDQARDLVRDEYAGRTLFLFKDPRLCRLLIFWHEVLESLEVDVKIVHIHRHPANVAASLHRRDRLENQFGLLLWLRYVIDAEAGSRGQVRGFTSFERIMADWKQEVGRLETALDLRFPRNVTDATTEVADFLSDSLIRFPPKDHGSSVELPGMVKQVYDIIERWISTGEDPADYPTLDAIGARLAEDAAIYASLITRRSVNRQFAAVEKAHKDEIARSQALAARLAETETQLQRGFHDLLSHRRALDKTRAEISTLSQRLESSFLEAERSGGEIIRLKTLILQQQADLARLARKSARDELKVGRRDGEISRLTALVLQHKRDAAKSVRDDALKTKRSEREISMILRQKDDLVQMVRKCEKMYNRERLARKNAETSVSKIYNSSSWRITAPLRAMGTAIKRLRGCLA